MEDASGPVETQETNVNIQECPSSAAKTNAKLPSGPTRWKPCSYRRRKQVSKKKVIPPKEQNPQEVGIGSRQTS